MRKDVRDFIRRLEAVGLDSDAVVRAECRSVSSQPVSVAVP